jgi:hypothetical protein
VFGEHRFHYVDLGRAIDVQPEPSSAARIHASRQRILASPLAEAMLEPIRARRG